LYDPSRIGGKISKHNIMQSVMNDLY